MSDQDWTLGNRAAYARMLVLIAGELGADTSEGKLASLLAERERTVTKLREVCAEHGDNDWPDNLYLPDVIEKHLARYLPPVDDGPGVLHRSR